MRGPYLESGESIVLTTDRVSVDNGVYDAMLTTRQMILIDNLYARFEPGTIPLTSIRSVRSGKAATGEPVVIITIQNPDNGVTTTRNIIFLQEPLENRKHDRDLWVQKLIELSVSGRTEQGTGEVLPKKEGEGMRPSVRRWVAPEIARPRPDNFPVLETPKDANITMDEEEPGRIPEQPHELFLPFERQETQPAEAGMADPGADTGVITFQAQEPGVPAVTGTDNESTGTSPDDEGIPELPLSQPSPPRATDTAGSITASILAAVRSLTGNHDQLPVASLPQEKTGDGILDEDIGEPCLQHSTRLTIALPEDRGDSAVVEQDAEPDVLLSREMVAARELPVFEEVDYGVRTSSQIPEISKEPPAREEPGEENPSDDPGVLHSYGPEPDRSVRGPDDAEPEPAAGEQEEPPAEEQPNAGSSTTPGSSASRPVPAPGINPFLIAGGAVLCLLLVIGAVLFLPGIQPQDHAPVTVGPTTVPTMTLSVPQPTITPETVREEGVRIRIVSPGFFTGHAGNPGRMQPVSGPGMAEVRVTDPAGLVSVSVEKQEYTGDELRVEIYSNGTLIASRSTTTPGGSIVLLIDPATGNPPGIPVPTLVSGNTTGTGRLEYY